MTRPVCSAIRGRRIPRLCLAVAALIVAATAQGVTCSISTGGLPFTAYSVYSATADTGNATISVTCNYEASDHGTITVNYTVGLSTGSSNSFVNRTMKIATDSLQYNIYTTNTYNVVWGDGTGGSSTQGGSMTLSGTQKTKTNTSTAYGRVPALQDVSVGNYTDNITVTVTY